MEVASGLARRAREGAFSSTERDRALTLLDVDFTAFLIVELSSEITATARRLLVAHTLRAGDAVQLASCLQLQDHIGEAVPFVAFDRRLRTAARREGLTIATARAGR